MYLQITALLTLFLSHSIFAASGYSLKPSSDLTSTFFTQKEYKKQLKLAGEKAKKDWKIKRKLSNTDRLDYDVIFDDDTKNIHSEIYGGYTWNNGQKSKFKIPGVKNNRDILKLVTKYSNDKNYQKLSPQAKFLAAQIALLKPLRGIVTRVQPLIQDSDGPLVHAAIITWIRSVNAGISAFNPNSEWEAGFNYLVKPYKGMKKVKTEAGLFNYMASEVLPNLVKFERRMHSLIWDKGNEGMTPFYFDNKVLYSTMNPVNQDDRFVVLDRGELLATLSATDFAIGSLTYSLGYNWDGLLKTMNSVAKTYGYLNTFVPKPEKMTAEKRIRTIRKTAGKTLFVKTKGGEAWTQSAYPWVKKALRAAKLSWKYIERYEDNNGRVNRFPLLDPRAFTPFSRIVNTSYNNIEDLVMNENEEVQSTLVDGEKVYVNFKAMFTNPPQDMKGLLATSFHNKSSGEKEWLTVGKNRTKMKYRNYRYGNPRGWDLSKYRPYFPNIQQEGIPKAARILSQVWGVGVLGLGLSPVLF